MHLDPTQIRDSLITRGFPYTSPKNLLISVHTVLGRIKEELDVIMPEAGKPAYRAKSSLIVDKLAANNVEGSRGKHARTLPPLYPEREKK